MYLHASPHLHINNVTLSSPTEADPLLPTPATFAVVNSFQPLPVREPPIDLKSHQEIKRKTWAALGEKDEGELAISVSHGWVRLVQEPGGEGMTVKLAPIQIQIDYELVIGGEVIEGIVFRRPGDGGDESVSVACAGTEVADKSSKYPICFSRRRHRTQRVSGRHASTACGSAVPGSWRLSCHDTSRVASRAVTTTPSLPWWWQAASWRHR